MATHTTTGGDSYGRKFTINRQNGQNDKNGKPFFFEWLRELPTDQTGRLFEERKGDDGEIKHFELFQALDGYLSGLERKIREIKGKKRDMLYLTLKDGIDAYVIEVGDYDGRYGIDLMKRLLHPDFSLVQKMRVSPYSLPKNNGGYNIGVSVFSGVNKMTAAWQDAHFDEMPKAVSETLRSGDVNWYYDDQAKWLFEKVSALILGIPNTAPSVGNTPDYNQPVNATVTANHNLPSGDPLAATASTAPPRVEPPPADDDLPF